jgi:hypothetical protein
MGRIMAQSGWILENVYFPEQPNEELSRFIKEMCSVTFESKDKDDAIDSMSFLAAMIRKDFQL